MNQELKIIKISHPEGWENSYSGHWNYYNLTPGSKGIWGNYKIEVNNTACRECDYWIIHESPDKAETVVCSPRNVILIPGEEKTQVPSYPQRYVDQFGLVMTSRDDLRHPAVIRDQYLCSWQVKKTYDELVRETDIRKTKELSAVISDSTWLEGHKRRYAFTNKLKGHFKDRLDWFCKGGNFIPDKWDGLAAYKYSLCIENSSHPHYFTEKLMDCYLAAAMPVYWGCSDITGYFPAESLIRIDINDFEAAIQTIEQAISGHAYEKRLKYVLQARDLVLNKYQIIAGIARILEENGERFDFKKSKIRIRPKTDFTAASPLRRVISRIKNLSR